MRPIALVALMAAVLFLMNDDGKRGDQSDPVGDLPVAVDTMHAATARLWAQDFRRTADQLAGGEFTEKAALVSALSGRMEQSKGKAASPLADSLDRIFPDDELTADQAKAAAEHFRAAAKLLDKAGA